MRFDGNLAWQQAMRLCKTNKELLLVLAGVFFFLPSLAASFFLGEVRVDVPAAGADPAQSKAALAQMFALYRQIGPYLLALGLAQLTGTLAMLCLLTDGTRPTVGQAIGLAVRRLPVAIGAALLFILGYAAMALVFGLVLGLFLAAALGFGGLGGPMGGTGGGAMLVGVVAFMAMVLVVMTRLSVLLPAIVVDGITHPARAMTRSWRLTKGNTAALLGFYVVLGMAYVVIGLVAYMALGLLSTLGVAPHTQAHTMVNSVISGLIGGVASLVFTAIIAAVHGQLAGSQQRDPVY